MSQHRADPFDLTDFAQPQKPKPPKAAIQQASEAHNFPSRQPAKPVEPPRRRRTGRNVQLNIKATADTIARFTAISDVNGWAFGETLERAIEALQRSEMLVQP